MRNQHNKNLKNYKKLNTRSVAENLTNCNMCIYPLYVCMIKEFQFYYVNITLKISY